MKKLSILLLAGMLALLPELSMAQYTGPGSEQKFYTVDEIVKKASQLDRSDELVKIRGNIIRQINSETFLFKDSTGTIKLEISPKHLPGRIFDETSLLIMTGEVDYDLLEGVEIEVKTIKFEEDTI